MITRKIAALHRGIFKLGIFRINSDRFRNASEFYTSSKRLELFRSLQIWSENFGWFS